MTPKEKAKELVNRYNNINITLSWIDSGIIKVDSIGNNLNIIDAKQCALIAVDEIVKVIYYEGKSEYIYWQEVKQEIEKL